MARRGRRGRSGRSGLAIKVVPLAALVGATAVIIASKQISGASSPIDAAKRGDWSGFSNALVGNLKTHWPVYIGLPLGVAVAGRIAKGFGNPSLKLGGMRVSAF